MKGSLSTCQQPDSRLIAVGSVPLGSPTEETLEVLPASLRSPDGHVWTAADAWIDGKIDHYAELATGRPVDP
jgi:hypothetical protein